MNTKSTISRNVDPDLDGIKVSQRRAGIVHSLISQNLVITLLLVIIPNILAFWKSLEALSPNRSAGISLLFSCAAVIFGRMVLKRLQNFPGVTQFHYIAPVFVSSYAIAVVIIFIFRFDYSIFVLLTSFTMTLVAQVAAFAIRERTAPRLCYILVDGGRTDDVTLPATIDVVRATEPAIPQHPRAVIVADLHYDHDPQWLRVFAQAALRDIPVYHVTEVIETLTGRVQIDHISENNFGSLLIVGTYSFIKRAFDTLVCLILFPMLLPLFAIVTVLIKMDSPGPIIFRQKRVGYRGDIFEVFKFRTMRVQTAVPDERTAAMTQQDDDRITRLGRFLRRSRIDELPQIVNVLRGEMSIIGPRPEALPLSQWYRTRIPFYEYRHIVRPGITGWAQVSQGHVTELTDIRDKLHYDFFYIKNFSYWMDALIVLRTIQTIFSGFGAK